MSPKITAVTINWNGYKDTIELIESLKKVKYGKLKVIVVENNSLPDEVEKLKSTIGDYAQLIVLNKNLGFAGGNNIGIVEALKKNADYILIINNDTIVEPNFLEPLINKFYEVKNAGIVAPQISYYLDPDKVWSAGGKISKIRASGFAISNKLESEVSQTGRFVDFVSGCCMLIKREVFQNVGLFDENYFLYVEDADFCYRVKKAGYKIYVTTQSKISHKVNKSTKKNLPSLPLYYTTRNRLYFAKKNFKSSYYLTVIYLCLTMVIKIFGWLLIGRLNNINSVFSAFTDFFNGKMGKANQKRFEI